VNTAQDQIEELGRVYQGVVIATEGQTPYYLIPAVPLPSHCSQPSVDVLLCPLQQNGYPTRLYFASSIGRPPHPNPRKQLNWTGTVRILERNWHVLSWKVEGGTNMRLLQMLLAHLEAFQ
jgi:hypothetical protein